MFEIQDLSCSPTGCIGFEKHAPGSVSMGPFLYDYVDNLKKKSMHLPGVQVITPLHPATKMCTPVAGCTLNFEHCRLIKKKRLTTRLLLSFIIWQWVSIQYLSAPPPPHAPRGVSDIIVQSQQHFCMVLLYLK